MNKLTILFLLTFCPLIVCAQSFKSKQLQYKRVKNAYALKEGKIDSILKVNQITTPHIYIRAFKDEMEYEIWAKNKNDLAYKKIITYDFCTTSGKLGPKRREGDYQIPEGFYYFNHFNPWSNFLLSLGINYPNASDKILGYKPKLGGNIYIHGSCVTIGCIPLTDDKIQEMYIIGVEAKNNGQSKIPIHIFPARLDGLSWELLQLKYVKETNLLDFWKNLKVGYDAFEKNHQIPDFEIDQNGVYIFKE